ncbi:hypothetical protein E4K67_12555 [Desulfosporosinus fructosivorans]|uniref:Uncharacterized protein n=1 Tax=Desulfosporosinus fructosivorans TaxID=2018669 RepID=A0A4Z0R4V8_9FIRM|nr:hypothetical protein [Desulfosporosinus fructosivorans]TGE37564.1 hypothetical protein E4K67_12555 [Desulfosporosinus fructosivorans]
MSDINPSDLEHLAENMEKAEKSEKAMSMVSFKDLFTPAFMTTYTDFANFGELLVVGKFNVNSFEEFLALLGESFDEFLKKTTKFQGWEEMQSTAVAEYMKKENSKI